MQQSDLLTAFVFASSLLTEPADAMTLGQIGKISQGAQPAAFESLEMISANGDAYTPQWNRAKAEISRDMTKLQSCLDDASNCTGAAQTNWREMVIGLRGQDENTQLQTVNVFFNRWQYRTDAETYGVSDKWVGPISFMENSGDCEDYAIAKYVTLTFLNFSDTQMRIMAVQDNNRGGIGHSVLNVTTRGGDVVLDNLSDQAYDAAQQTGYTPRFAVNQAAVYTYAQPAQPEIIYASWAN